MARCWGRPRVTPTGMRATRTSESLARSRAGGVGGTHATPGPANMNGRLPLGTHARIALRGAAWRRETSPPQLFPKRKAFAQFSFFFFLFIIYSSLAMRHGDRKGGAPAHPSFPSRTGIAGAKGKRLLDENAKGGSKTGGNNWSPGSGSAFATTSRARCRARCSPEGGTA